MPACTARATVLLQPGLNKIRHEIDRIDSDIIELLSKRSNLVSEAGKTREYRHEVRDKDRVDKVIMKIKLKAEKTGLDPNIAENIYRNIISCFIQKRMKEYREYNYELQDI